MKSVTKLALMTGLALAALMATDRAETRADEFSLTAGASHPPFVPWVSVLQKHVVPQSVERAAKAGHKLDWTEAYAGALFDFQNALEGVEGGLADLAWVGTLWEPSKLPLTNVTFAAPFVTDDVVVAAEIQDEMYENVPALREQLEKYNQVYLGPQAIDGYVLITKKPIGSLDDLKGLKLYAPGAVARWLQGTGAVAVDGGLPVYYQGIEAGITDGAVVPGSGIFSFKLHEVAPHVTITSLGGCICGALTMNKDTWDRLPQELQAMFRQLGQEYGEMVARAIAENREKHFALLKENGATFSTLPMGEQRKWAQLIPDIAGEWVKRLEGQGLPAKEVLNAYVEGAKKRGAEPLRDWLGN